MNKLAIVLPVYKPFFLEKTLMSLEHQTCQDFVVYIGNDNSPYEIQGIIDGFKRKLNIVYKKFETNLGGVDLVKQWQRCVDLIGKEEYVWLFSDDDVMESRCVELFYDAINRDDRYDVYHFDINIIDENDNLLRCPIEYPITMRVNDFFSQLYMGRIEARMPEFIFKRQALEQSGGFVNYDLAWRSDNATVINTAVENGIKTIKGAKVNWREGSANISGILSKEIVCRKDNSTINFFNWVNNFFVGKKLKYTIDMLRLLRTYAYSLGQTKGRHCFSYYWAISRRYNYLNNIAKRIIFIFWCYKSK